jgi:hypothetical protein
MHMNEIRLRPLARAASAVAVLAMSALAGPQPVQGQTGTQGGSPPTTAAPIERLGPTSLRVGNLQVNTATKEISVRGVVTEAEVLEFVAITKGGFKGYESALELDTNAINLNVALILLGIDPARSVAPKRQFDPAIPQGDAVEMWVEWGEPNARRKVRAEQLIYNRMSKTTLPEGPWVYTGSVFVEGVKAYLADIEGALIGFAHTQANIIDSPRPLPADPYGSDILNPDLNLKPGTTIQFTIRVLPRGR